LFSEPIFTDTDACRRQEREDEQDGGQTPWSGRRRAGDGLFQRLGYGHSFLQFFRIATGIFIFRPVDPLSH
jgi:hypothetical protein